MSKTTFVLLLICISLSCCTSCRKSAGNPVINSAADQIILSTQTMPGDSVKLSWTKLGNDSLISYSIYGNFDTTKTTADVLISNVLKTTTEYTVAQPLCPYARYYIKAYFMPNTVVIPIVSNKVVVERSDLSFMQIALLDALLDKASNMLYIYDTAGDIILYDVINKKISKQISINATIGYCCIDTFNGTKELYIPTSHGRLLIYDATILEKIDEIDVGSSLSSVVSRKGILFTCGQFVTSYKRDTKSLVDQIPSSGARIKFMPNSRINLLHISNIEANLYRFTSTGIYSTTINFNGSGSVNYPPYYPVPLEVFPDGSKFIDGSYGDIYDDTFYHISSLSSGNNRFTSFDFDTTQQLIYAGNDAGSIQCYSMNNNQLTKTIKTIGHPEKVFYNKGATLSVSSNINEPFYKYYSTEYIFIEEF